ncbi:unnamed protein product [Auanema sp. JU1783]|nr:unnamed protein product [Auanema sp. JU1783]
MVQLWATVITGFEEVAQQEINRFDPNAQTRRGAVCFSTDISNIPECLKLRSIDNLHAILYSEEMKNLQSMENSEALRQIKLTTKYVNWAEGIEYWQTAFGEEISGGSQGLMVKMKTYEETGVNTEITADVPTFRVTCNRTGEKELHQFSSMEAARVMGAELNNMFGWKPNMKNFNIEVILSVRNETVTVMISLNAKSLFCRNIIAFGPTTMRSTMCFCMVSLVQPKKNRIIVDPMCGGGSIPIEGAIAFPQCTFIAGDNHEKALERCYENAKDSKAQVSFLRWDAMNLPLLDNSVDAIVTDLPFGKKIGSVSDNRVTYPKLLLEWHRVVRTGGRIVVMTHDKRSLQNSLPSLGGKLRTVRRCICNQGGLTTLCFVFKTL